MFLIAKWIVILFGAYIIYAGFLMLAVPEKARSILRKAGSTPLINYTEITLRLIAAIGLILFAELSRCPMAFKVLGWFMFVTCLILYFVPRRMHHNYSLRSAEILKPLYFRLLSPLAFLFGASILYCVLG